MALRVDAPAVPAGTRTAVLKNAPANRSTEKRLNCDYLRSAGRGVAQQLEVERDGQAVSVETKFDLPLRHRPRT